MRDLKIRHLALPFLALAACSESDHTSGLDVESAFGGITETASTPVAADPDFADPELTIEDTVVPSSLPTDPAPAGRRARIAVAWGYLRPHRDATEVVDWSGTLCASEGALLRPLRVLRFEPRTDMIVRDQSDRHCLTFTSQTRPHADGILLELVSSGSEPPSLTFTSAPITDTLTLDGSNHGSKVVEVDEAGHVLAYHVIRPDAGMCHEGFLRGQWSVREGGGAGVMRGRWVSGDGDIKGYLRGVFGKRSTGRNVFFAKIADSAGVFLGVIAGVYGQGELAGVVLGRGHIVAGRVHGRYEEGTADDKGMFMGRWATGCGEDPGEGTETDDDEPSVPTDGG